MAHVYFDLVAQNTEITGTGAYVLTTTPAFKRSFSSVMSNGDTTDIRVSGKDNAGNDAWEVALATYSTSGVSLARTTIRASSTGSAINWGTGLKTVTMVQAAGSIVSTTPTANRIKATGITPENGAVPIGNGSDFTVGTITGTANRVTVTNSAGGITLSGPQDIHTGASPTFTGLTVSSVTIGTTVVATSSGPLTLEGASGVVRIGANSTGNGIQVDAASAGNSPFIRARGSDSAINMNYGCKGGASHFFSTDVGGAGQGIQLQVSHTASANRYPTLTGSNGGDPAISTSAGRLSLRSGDGAVIFPSVGTTASAANAYLDNAASNNLLRSTSSMRYKTDAEPIDIGIVRETGPKLIDAMIWYRSLAPADRPGWSWYGMGAEKVATIDPRLVHWTYPADAYEEVVTGTDEVEVPVLEDVEETGYEVCVEEGRAVLRPVTRTVQQQVVDLLPIVTEDGQPVTDAEGNPLYHPVPRVEKVARDVMGWRLKDGAEMIPDGVQYERVALILALYLADKIGAA